MPQLTPISTLLQELQCHSCRRRYPAKFCHRIMNFTTMDIRFLCVSCRQIIGALNFHRWNTLHRLFEKGDEKEIKNRPGIRKEFKKKKKPLKPRAPKPEIKNETKPKEQESQKEKQSRSDKIYQRNVPG
jgi:hypothetical protein